MTKVHRSLSTFRRTASHQTAETDSHDGKIKKTKKHSTYPKGLIFTMDVVFAIGITLILLMVSIGVLVTTKATAVNDINIKRAAADVVAVLDYNDIIDTFDAATIQETVNASLPLNVRMHMIIGKYNKDGLLLDQITINDDIPENYFFGKWVFVTTDQSGFANNFYLVRYKVAFA